jgi:hypothetical protein
MADDKKPSNYDEVMDAKMLEKKDAAYNAADSTPPNPAPLYMTKTPGGKAKRMASGGSASSRADGIAQRGKTRGTVVMCGGGMYKK